MKKFLLAVLGVLIIIAAIVLIKTYTYPFKKNTIVSGEGWKPVKNDSAIIRLSGGIKIPTVSTGSLGTFNYAPFDQFKTYLKTSYPLVYQHTENVEVNQYGLVFRLKGSNPSLEPVLFLSHMDVVPPGDADIKNNEDNIFRPDDQPLEPVAKVAEDWDFAPFQEL